MQHTGPEVVRHTAPQQKKHGTETDNDGKTKNSRAVAETHAAALVLQGTQPGNITQAPNSSNVCNHAICKMGVRVGGLRQLHSLDSKAVAETIIVDQHDWAWVAGLWPLATGTG